MSDTLRFEVPTALQYFASLVAEDEGFALLEAAIAVAQDEYPRLDPQGVLAQVDALADRLKRRIPADAVVLQKLRFLNRYFFQDLGFAGNVNNYYDPRGVSFPGHFLVKLRAGKGEVVIDPLTGQSLSRAELEERLLPYRRSQGLTGDFEVPLGLFLQAAPPRDVIARLLRNLKEIHRSAEDWPRLLAVCERLVVLLPQAWEERRDRGLVRAELGQDEAAAQDLLVYLKQMPQADDTQALRERLRGLADGRHGPLH